MTKKLPPPCDTCPCAGWGMECEGIRAKPAAAVGETSTSASLRAAKAERAVNLLAGSHRRAEEAEATVTRVREWIAGEPVDARNEFGNGYREALRDITDLLGPVTP